MGKFYRRHKQALVGLLFVLPWIVGFLLFTLVPMFTSIRYSFNKVGFPLTGISLTPVGIQNYVQVIMSDPDFKIALPAYLLQLICYVPMVLIFSVLLALLLNSPIKGRTVVRAIFFLPVIIVSGPVLENLRTLGGATLRGLADFPLYEFFKLYLPGVIGSPLIYIFDNSVLILWYCGVPILIFLSGLLKVDRNIYEAAMVDGASAWQSFWKITIPTLKPFFFLNGVFIVVEISISTQNPVVKLIKDSLFHLTRGFGFAAAVSMIFFVIIIIAVLILFLLFGREKKDVVVQEVRRKDVKP